MQGVAYNKLAGELQEGSLIDNLWIGKLNTKCGNGDTEIVELMNGTIHGPTIFYDFDGKVKKEYYSNGEKIFLQ